MTIPEIRNALDEIRDMSDEEIADNAVFIRNVSEKAMGIITELIGVKLRQRKQIRNLEHASKLPKRKKVMCE